MILKKIKLSPFGGITNKRIEFEPGLNIILGPNEAGKSTLVNAIFSVLFLPSNLRKSSRDWKDNMVNFLPYPDGDTAQISLEFICSDGDNYTILRSWGEEKKDTMILADGSEVNNQRKIEKILAQYLKYGRGTYEGVFLARQEDMINTVDKLKENPEAVNNLSDILRNVILHTGGVSVEELQSRIQDELKSLLSLWDFERDEPKGQRGIDNPYIKGKGEIISLYYEVEELKQEIIKANEIEENIKKLTEALNQITSEFTQINLKVTSMQEMENDIKSRAALEPKLALILEKEKDLKQINIAWPTTQEKIKNLEKELHEKTEQRKILIKEKEQAVKVLADREIRNLYDKIKPLKEKLSVYEKDLLSMPEITEEKLKELTNVKAQISELKTTLKAMKLKGKILTKMPLDINITRGLEAVETIQVAKEESFEADGKVLLESSEWSIEIQSGQKDVEKIIEEIESNQTYLKNELNAVGIENVGEAAEIVAKKGELNKKIEQLKIQIKALLGDITYEELEKQVGEIKEDPNVRAPEIIEEELKNIEATVFEDSSELKILNAKVKEWEEKYTSIDNALNLLVELKSDEKELQSELAKLKPLPEDYKTPEQFIEELQINREKKDKLQNDLYDLKTRLNEVLYNQPEESVEELKEKLEILETKLKKLKSRARAIMIIEAEFNNIINEIDEDTYEPMIDSFISYFYPITNYRYNSVEMEGGIPQLICSKDEARELPIDLLSTGTTRGLALALRLAIAEHLMGKDGGFIIMDDPLVDLDPERKQQAAEILREFAKTSQIIITTCDPNTAKLLQGNQIDL